MKKLTGALVLSFSLLLASACRSGGETRDQEDASTPTAAPSSEQNPSPAGAIDKTRSALSGDTSGTPSSGTVQAPPGVKMGDSGPSSEPGTTTGSSKPSGEGTTVALSEAERAAQENCLDKWLKSKKLDQYGHDEGTMYAGGSPLFNEATGESTDRLEYVYKRKPEAKQACATAGKTQKQ